MATLNQHELFDHLNKDKYLFLNHYSSSLEILNSFSADELETFTQSWNDLSIDTYIEEDNPFRLRRYAVLRWENNVLDTIEHEPHYQTRFYNNVYGGIDREFTPITHPILNHPIFKELIHWNIQLLNTGEEANWRVQCHQFRIRTTAEQCGKPTPEGIHQDGSDFVFIMLIDRKNISGGISQIYNNNKELIQSTTLLKEGESILINDRELFHSVSEVTSCDKKSQGHRDVLVFTFHKDNI